MPGYGVRGSGEAKEPFSVMELDTMTPTKQQQRHWEEEGVEETRSKCGGGEALPGTPEHVESAEKMRDGCREWRRRDNLVRLNVGGRLFETSKETVCYDGQSMLAAMIKWDMKDDENEVHWIDRDPGRFKHVLNYLRSQKIWLDTVCKVRAVQEEADFFNLDGLYKLCEARVKEILTENDEQKQQMMQRLRGVENTVKGLSDSLENNRSSQRKEPILGVRRRRLDYGNYNEPVFRMDEDF